MNIILETFKLIRFQHWLKNLIIFIPIFFSKDLLDFNKFVLLLNIFIIFCLSSSLIYILNDIKDREADKNNAVKKFRPIASGTISLSFAYFLIFVLLLSIIFYLFFVNLFFLIVIISSYLIFNLFYTFFLKKIEIIDILTLLSFYLLRIFSGAIPLNIEISYWLLAFVFTSSLIVVLGKRLIDFNYLNFDKKKLSTSFYKESILYQLIKIVGIFQILFYFIFCLQQTTIDKYGNSIIFSLFFVILGTLRFIKILKKNKQSSDTIILIFKDIILSLIIISYIIYCYVLIYII